MDARVPFSTVKAAFGVSGTVTPPDGTPVVDKVVWITPQTDSVPAGGTFTRREQQYLLAIDRDTVPAVPIGTVIVAPDRHGEAVRTWVVEGLDFVDADHHRAMVLPVPT